MNSDETLRNVLRERAEAIKQRNEWASTVGRLRHELDTLTNPARSVALTPPLPADESIVIGGA